MESDTPRTDANVINVDYETREPDGEPSQVIEEVVLVEFARQLERELAAAIKQRDEATSWLRDACEEIARIETRFYDALTPQQIAERNGWDCFGEKEGGGA